MKAAYRRVCECDCVTKRGGGTEEGEGYGTYI